MKIALYFFIFIATMMQQASLSQETFSKFAKDIEIIREWIKQPIVINSVINQNKKYNDYKAADILNIDRKWRSGDKVLINQILDNELSKFLSEKMMKSNGHYTEIFVMDNKGLNVGQSIKTSDFWQGDEAKWSKVFPNGPDAIHISDLEEDKSTKVFQTQVSLPIVFEGKNIGVITVGINDEQFKK